MNVPEILVYVRTLTIGFVAAEVCRMAYSLGFNFGLIFSKANGWVVWLILIFVASVCLAYSIVRGGVDDVKRIGSSYRIDLLLTFGIGIWSNLLMSTYFHSLHEFIRSLHTYWAPTLVFFFCIVMLSSLALKLIASKNLRSLQIYFMQDEDIKYQSDDLLDSTTQAKSFAETVLASSPQQGLIFGIDGPWGIGKTSFVNLVHSYWLDAKEKPIVCRFEPIRYASEPDLTARLIRDLSSDIQRQLYVPEFRPVATRYSRLVKGISEISFLGFKFSMETTSETIDQLLEDIDEVLKRVGRQVIIVIDDLDRLDASSTNSVLFAARKTFRLSQATYILCYDTEVLANSQEEGSRAREFLEKFVTVKLSLFVDTSGIRDFLRTDWQNIEQNSGLIPSDTMLKLGSVLTELSDILDSDLASNYIPLVGDLRKVKRFVNSMLIMQLEKTDLGRTDFNNRDLINLILLHLHFPGIFRHIYGEETEGRSGIFSVRRSPKENEFINSDGFVEFTEMQEDSAKFLLTQLFDVSSLSLNKDRTINEGTLSSRACFNDENARNLEDYLKLIVRFATPEPQKTFILYRRAVERVLKGGTVASVLESPEFQLESGEHSHDMFWSVLVSQAHKLTPEIVDDVIYTLIKYLPFYSSVNVDDRGLRQISIYTLIRLLDRAGWRDKNVNKMRGSKKDLRPIAWRIFGEESFVGNGILHLLHNKERGVLAWYDIMLFRLQCSADRQGQIPNVIRSLVDHKNHVLPTFGVNKTLAIVEMRYISQVIFKEFEKEYIIPRRNFYSDVDITPEVDFLGKAFCNSNYGLEVESKDRENLHILSAKMTLKIFVIYQLANAEPPKGSGVGCGYYDEFGENDGTGISVQMNQYIFEVCFNPSNEKNVVHFLDFCLSRLVNSTFLAEVDDEEGYISSKNEIANGFDSELMAKYWMRNKEIVYKVAKKYSSKRVVTTNYTASYREHLGGVFQVLDELANDYGI